MNEKLIGARPTNLGAKRFLELEQRVSDIEGVLELMQKLLRVNNASLETIIDAINRERPIDPDAPKAWGDN